jgi:hypothetical protein
VAGRLKKTQRPAIHRYSIPMTTDHGQGACITPLINITTDEVLKRICNGVNKSYKTCPTHFSIEKGEFILPRKKFLKDPALE